MKLKYKYLMMAGVLAAAFTACSDKDDTIDPGEVTEIGNRGEETVVQLRVTQSIPGTYASSVDDPATANESKITTPEVHVYVFDDAQVFEKYEVLGITANGTNSSNGGDRYSTEEMVVSSGNKYFYVFANVDNNPIATPATGSTRTTFEKRVLSKTVANLTGNNKDMFVMGTLYGQMTSLNGDGVTGSPETVTVSIGRLAAKITLVDSDPAKGEAVAGNFIFTDTEYRVVNVPNQMYLVGQWSNGFRTQASQVTTPYFNEDLSTTALQSSYFNTNPTSWGSTETAPGTPIYTLENTYHNPLKGTATAIQVRYQYAPASGEIYDVANPETPGASLGGNTFWMAIFADGTKMIYNGDPTGLTHPTLGTVTDVQEYTDGYVYYTIYVADNSETTAQSLKYAVIRNHSYKIKVNTIARLGNSTPDVVDPTDPVETNNVIDFDITVDPWYLIEQDVDL
ncbi:MAG: Mfa1 family fimbria major subunit [Tannerellaceae bacterium]|nr:Mfa1 family fimbria major subunit [Tannerellaceae bacterium]